MKTSSNHLSASPGCRRTPPDLLLGAIDGVMRHAQDGQLPLFAWTLGLPQQELQELIAHCFSNWAKCRDGRI